MMVIDFKQSGIDDDVSIRKMKIPNAFEYESFYNQRNNELIFEKSNRIGQDGVWKIKKK